MHPEIDELRPRLKEILYDCAVDIKATKAALYLLDTSVRKFELVAEFGFRAGVRSWAGYNDPMVDRCSRGRSPFFVNSMAAEPRLSDMMFETASERLLGVPIFSRGQLVGFIDIRDKQGKQPFEQPDAAKAQSIGERVLSLLTTKNVWNQKFITVADVPIESAVVKRTEATRPLASGMASTMDRFSPAAGPDLRFAAPAEPVFTAHSAIVSTARIATSALLTPTVPDVLTDAELVEARDALRGVLLLPGALAAVFTGTGAQEIAANGKLTPDGEALLQNRLHGWLKHRGESIGTLRSNFQTPLGELVPEVSAAQMKKVYIAPVTANRLSGMYLTVAFADQPDRSTQELLAVMLDLLQTSIEHSLLFGRMQSTKIRIAWKLLEPDFTSYPALRRHTDAVALRSEKFAQFLGLTGVEVENVRITALVHDVGMRFLDYDQLYKKRNLTSEELALLREHVTVGAAVVEPLLGPEIARAVLGHHERVDGAGYPNKWRGTEIPLMSRILQLADTYVSITEPDTYRTPDRPDAALATLGRGAGAQFDAELAAKFIEMMEAS